MEGGAGSPSGSPFGIGLPAFLRSRTVPVVEGPPWIPENELGSGWFVPPDPGDRLDTTLPSVVRITLRQPCQEE